MKPTLYVLGLLIVLPFGASSQSGPRPNIILILSDDQGSVDLNCYGANDLYTPNLDALAQRGIRFTQFYVGAPVCSPSRASLLTGRYPQRAGVPGNVPSQPGFAGMPTDEVTIAEMLKGAGYKTALFGKWHLGTIPECEPLGQGFDEFLGHRGGCIDNYSHFFYWAGPNRHDLQRGTEEYWEDGTHISDMIVREANRFIEENKDNPFFLFLPFNIPHYPLQAREEFRERSQNLEEPRRAYAALISDMDASVGRILRKLDETGVRENTMIVFLSDHGHSTEERANFGGGSAGPFRGAKFSLLEGGIRVPCIVSWPGRFAEGEVRDQMATSLDWFPTLAEICGAPIPDRKLDGKNLLSVLDSAEAKSPHEVFHWGQGNQWAVREGNWKLVVNAKDTDHRVDLAGDDQVFLSDLSMDVTETSNLAKDRPDVVARLTAMHEEWEREVANR